jgi:hypothetical protein
MPELTMTTMLRYLGMTLVAATLAAAPAKAQIRSDACLPVDRHSRSVRDDLAAMASDTTTAGAERRQLYHLPVAADQQVVQETVGALCARAIDAIRTRARDDGKGPDQVYLFRVEDVWVVKAAPGTPFVGVVWTFDASMRAFLGGVVQ